MNKVLISLFLGAGILLPTNACKTEVANQLVKTFVKNIRKA